MLKSNRMKNLEKHGLIGKWNMSDIEEFNSLMHTFHCQGRAIEMLYEIRQEMSSYVNESKPDSDMYRLRDKLNSAITFLEYKW